MARVNRTDRSARPWANALVAIALGALVSVVSLGTMSRPVGAAETVTVEVSPENCRRLVRHVPSDDVAYKPGVDAYGRPVAPADLPGSAVIKAPEKVTIALTLDFLRGAGVGEDSALLDQEVSVGSVTYDINSGRLEYNGQPLSDPEAGVLAAGCKKADGG